MGTGPSPGRGPTRWPAHSCSTPAALTAPRAWRHRDPQTRTSMCWWGAGAVRRCGQQPPAAAIPLALPLDAQVLLQEPNPGIEYEFWLPRGHPQHSMVDTSALRQPQPRGAGSPPPAEPPLPTVPPRARDPITEPLPPRSPPGVRSAAGDLPHPPTPPGCAGVQKCPLSP